MSADNEIEEALLAIHSRLGTIEGKVNVVARAEREELLADLRGVVQARPLIGQIYLLLDGERTQRDILDELKTYGVVVSEATVSRRMGEMATEHGIALLVTGGTSKVYRKDREMESILNLSQQCRKWLTDSGKTVPEHAPRRRKARSS